MLKKNIHVYLSKLYYLVGKYKKYNKVCLSKIMDIKKIRRNYFKTSYYYDQNNEIYYNYYTSAFIIHNLIKDIKELQSFQLIYSFTLPYDIQNNILLYLKKTNYYKLNFYSKIPKSFIKKHRNKILEL
jgi:hypothetical protein